MTAFCTPPSKTPLTEKRGIAPMGYALRWDHRRTSNKGRELTNTDPGRQYSVSFETVTSNHSKAGDPSWKCREQLDEWITTPPVTAIKRARKTTPAHADVFTATIAVRPKRPVRAADPFAIPALAAATEIRFPVAECPARADARNALRADLRGPYDNAAAADFSSLHSARRRADRLLYSPYHVRIARQRRQRWRARKP